MAQCAYRLIGDQDELECYSRNCVLAARELHDLLAEQGRLAECHCLFCIPVAYAEPIIY